MHPDPAFRWTDEAAMRAFVAAQGFATIAVANDGAPLLAHAPLTLHDDGTLRFHIARANRVAPYLDGARATVCVLAHDHYVSPRWYATTGRVPTWNYVAVEIEGRVSALDDTALVDQLDALAAAHEAPSAAWTRADADPAAVAAMLTAIRGFTLAPEAWRGTVKLSQNGSAADRAGIAAALARLDRPREAALVESAAA